MGKQPFFMKGRLLDYPEIRKAVENWDGIVDGENGSLSHQICDFLLKL